MKLREKERDTIKLLFRSGQMSIIHPLVLLCSAASYALNLSEQENSFGTV